uniref:Uncharacterized protein n=1 Tax=Arundo donax TaxID=35708 RepID=A0A0A9BII0_ARUDO
MEANHIPTWLKLVPCAFYASKLVPFPLEHFKLLLVLTTVFIVRKNSRPELQERN